MLDRAAEAQRRNGLLPTPRQNDELFSGILEKGDRKRSDQKPPPKRERIDHSAGPSAQAKAEIEARGGRALNSAEAAANAPEPVRLRTAQRIELALVRRRLELLRGYPDWNAKLIDAWNKGAAIAFRTNQPFRVVQGPLIMDVVEKSSTVFGDWRKLPRKRRMLFGGGGIKEVT